MRDDADRSERSLAQGGEPWLTPSIQRAHERSKTFGLRASMHPGRDVLTSDELRMKREQNRMLCARAIPVMDAMREQIANTHSMIVLTDAHGLILRSIGDDDFLQRAEKIALREGASWAEDRQGTNAIGTAIAERSPTVVHGEQHYLAAHRRLTCAGVPILDPYGDLAGVLAVAGDCRSYHQHTMALAKISVQMIENHLFADAFRDTLQVAFDGRPECVGTLMEGIAAFTRDGRFLSANRSAQRQIGLSLAAMRAHTLSSLFGLTPSQLIERLHAGNGRCVSLMLRNGKAVCASIRFRRATSDAAVAAGPDGMSAGTRSALVPARPAVSALRREASSRLAALDTGDPQIRAVIAKVRKVLGKDIPVLITGETGTGKELLARAIHDDSPRSAGPFVAVNCASIPESLIESELFGYEEGAFTGARRKGAIGTLLQAHRGTLFLDEIGDMPYPLQVRLLRVLQERIVNPLGSSRSIPVDVAIICATHRNLREMIEQSRFREDLYYRLNGLVVKLPPLRARTDLAAVIGRMLQAISSDGIAGVPLAVADDVMALFEQCAWPGNFRQLGNLLRTAAALVDDDGRITREHLPEDFFEDLRERSALAPPLAGDAPVRPGARLDDVQACAIAAAVARHRGNVSAAARSLGISRNTVYRRMPSPSPGGDAQADALSDPAPFDTVY